MKPNFGQEMRKVVTLIRKWSCSILQYRQKEIFLFIFFYFRLSFTAKGYLGQQETYYIPEQSPDCV
jgi:hypothetical protein